MAQPPSPREIPGNHSRMKATVVASGMIYVLAVMVILSLNPGSALSKFQLFGTADTGLLHSLNQIFFTGKEGFMNILDHSVANWMLPVTGLSTTIFVGWVMHRNVVVIELKFLQRANEPFILRQVLIVLIRFVSPLAILYILYRILFLGQDFT